ncbi:MAG: hypothetical protein ACOYEV_18950, partial [Candidatus Nanopelagicales bacterium]
MSWDQLVGIYRDGAAEAARADDPPASCPLCGQPLTQGQGDDVAGTVDDHGKGVQDGGKRARAAGGAGGPAASFAGRALITGSQASTMQVVGNGQIALSTSKDAPGQVVTSSIAGGQLGWLL